MSDYKVSLGVDVDDSALSQLKKTIDNITSKKQKVNFDTSDDTSSSLKRLKSLQGEVNRLNIAMAKNPASNKYAEMATQLNRAETEAKELRATLETKVPASMFNGIDASVETTRNKIKILKAEAKDANVAMSNSIKDGLSLGSYDAKIEQYRRSLNKLTGDARNARAAVDAMENAMLQMQQGVNSNNLKQQAAGLRVFKQEAQKAAIEIKRLQAVQKEQGSFDTNEARRNSIGLKAQIWLKENSAAAEMFGAKIRALTQELKTCDAVRMNGIEQEIRQIQLEARLAGKAAMTFGDKLKMQFGRLGAYMGASMAIMETIQLLRLMARNVLEVDTAMTGLKRVTDLSASGYANMYDEMVVSAKEYGSTLTDMINATADWSRAGFAPDVAKGLAEVTTMYQHIADLDYNESVENLLTAYKGFEGQLTKDFGGDTVAAVGYIGDMLNELDK